MTAALEDLIAEETARPLSPDLQTVANAVRRHYPLARAILLYGSTLRGADLSATLADMYVLLAKNGDAGANLLSRLGQALLPPNVYYFETSRDGRMLRAKIAVLTLDAFAAAMRPRRRNPYFWARFAQPARIVFAASEGDRRSAISSLAAAHRTLYAYGTALAADPPGQFERAFRLTYATELRAEGPDRAASIAAANLHYYRKAAAAMTDVSARTARWPLRRLQGKTLSVLRLLKAAFTFAGGADYIAAKLERHGGSRLVLKPWQRRHPILAGLVLLPRLIRRGVVK